MASSSSVICVDDTVVYGSVQLAPTVESVPLTRSSKSARIVAYAVSLVGHLATNVSGFPIAVADVVRPDATVMTAEPVLPSLVAEMVAVKSGLGYVLWDAYYIGRMDIVIADMVSIGVLGFLSDQLLLLIQARVLHWKQFHSV